MPTKIKQFLGFIQVGDDKAFEQALLKNKKLTNCNVDNISHNGVNYKNVSPLVWAVVHGKATMVRALLENDANPNAEFTRTDTSKKQVLTLTPFKLALLTLDAELSLLMLEDRPNVHNKAAVNVRIQGLTLLNFILRHGRQFHQQEKLQELKDQIFKAGFNLIDAKDPDGFTELAIRVLENDLDGVKFLLEKCANPNAVSTDKKGNSFSPLGLAIEKNLPQIFETLLERGADIQSAKNKPLPNPPLHIAAENGRLEMLRELLKRGANINAFDQSGSSKRKDLPELTALHLAVQHGHESVVKELLERGADCTLRAKVNGEPAVTPLEMARQIGHTNIVSMLTAHLQKLKLEDSTFFERESLPKMYRKMCDRFKNSSLKNFEILLQSNPSLDINETDAEGNTYLNVAVERRSLETVDLLLKLGAKVSIGICPINIAAKKGDFEIVSRLIEANKTEEKSCRDVFVDGTTALHVAVLNGDQAIVRLLLNFGCDPSLFSSGGLNALHYALQEHQYEIAKLLLQTKKVDINQRIKDEQQSSPFTLMMFSSKLDSLEGVSFLLKHGANPNLPLYANPCIDFADLGFLSPLSSLATPIIWSAVIESLEKFQLFYKDSDKKLLVSDDNTKNPLFQAVICNQVDILKWFLDALIKEQLKPANIEAIIAVAEYFKFDEMIFLLRNFNTAPTSERSSSTAEQPAFVDGSLKVKESGRAYLLRLGFTESEIEEMRNANKRRKMDVQNRYRFLSPATKDEIPKYISLLPEEITIPCAELKRIVNRPNCFLFVDKIPLEAQGCAAKSLERFMDDNTGNSIKFLQGDGFKRLVCINDTQSCDQTFRVEMKLHGTPERILGFTLLANDGKTTLYIFCLYLPHGLHEKSDTKSLESSSSVITVTLPSVARPVAAKTLLQP